MLKKIPAGDYTLTEITAPSGYKIAESINFTVLPTGEIQTVVMKDAREDTLTPTPDNTPNRSIPAAYAGYHPYTYPPRRCSYRNACAIDDDSQKLVIILRLGCCWLLRYFCGAGCSDLQERPQQGGCTPHR